MRVRVSPRAKADLDEIFAYILERSPAGARRLSIAFRSALSTLAHYPDIGPQTDIEGVRVFLLKSHAYKIFYRVRVDEVEIVHLRHDAQQPFSG